MNTSLLVREEPSDFFKREILNTRIVVDRIKRESWSNSLRYSRNILRNLHQSTEEQKKKIKAN